MNRVEREGNNYDVFSYYNDTGAALEQYDFVLDVADDANDDAVTFPVFGYVPDDQGIANGAYGNIKSIVGGLWQTTQIDGTVTALERGNALYMSPGAGDLHAAALAGDYCVGKLTEDQGANTYVKFQACQPFPVEATAT